MRDRVLPYALLTLVIAAIVVAFWPGQMNADTLTEIAQVQWGLLSNQYSPILEWVWHPLYTIGFGPGWVLTAQVGLFVISAFALLRRWFSPLAAAGITALIALGPQAFGELGLVGRDAWFLSFYVACLACVARAQASEGRRRLAWLVGAVVAAWLTLAVRQNAAAVVFLPLACLLAPPLARRISVRRLRHLTIAVAACVAGVAATLAMMGTQLAIDSRLSLHNANITAPLYLFDLASLSRRANHDYIPASVLHDRSMSTLRATSNVISINRMITGPGHPIPYPLTDQQVSALKHAWIHRVLADPVAYLAVRLQTAGAFLGLTQDSIWIYQPVIDPNIFGFHTSVGWANRIANDYEQAFTDALNNGGALFAPWLYLLACLVIAVALLRTRSRSWAYAPVLVVALSPLTYQVGLLFGLMGSNYRYEFPCVVVAELAVALGLRLLWLRARSRSPRERNASVSASAAGVPIS